jgi:hypothetical protein
MICQDCGRDIPISKPQKVLCIPCKYAAVRAKYKAKRDAKKIKKTPVVETCPACECKFEKRTKDQKFCNDECRIIMDNKKFNLKWANEKPAPKKVAYPKNRKPFDPRAHWGLNKFNACRG